LYAGQADTSAPAESTARIRARWRNGTVAFARLWADERYERIRRAIRHGPPVSSRGWPSGQPPRELGWRDHDELGSRPCKADVHELVEAIALGRELDQDDDLALHPLEATDRPA
jgi:hypothetical protein